MGLFGGGEMKEAPQPIIKETPWAPEARGVLTNLMKQAADMPLRQVAGMTPTEQQAQSVLGNILSGGAFQDPSESPMYLGMRREMQREEEAGADTLRRRAQLGGVPRSSSAGKVEGNYRAGMANQRMSLLGQMYEQERNRDNPYNRLQAVSQYGALPRDIQQQQNNASYERQYGNTMLPYQQQSQLAETLLGYQPWYQPQMYQEQEGGLGGLLSSLAPMAGTIMGAMSGAGGIASVLGGASGLGGGGGAGMFGGFDSSKLYGTGAPTAGGGSDADIFASMKW